MGPSCRAIIAGAAIVVLAACGGSQPPIGVPGVTPLSAAAQAQQQRTGSTKYQVVFSFGNSVNGYDGVYPLAPLIDVKGALYGTTVYGGSYGYGSHVGSGTIFSISTSGTENVLYSFSGGGDGASPFAPLTDVKDRLYGTASTGGTYGNGTIFSVGTAGTGFRVVHAFRGGTADGADPMAGLLAVNGKLYGTTQAGGTQGEGTAFSISLATGKERILHSFGLSSDGANPLAALVNVQGKLYGTTQAGGASGAGTVFSLSVTGKEMVLHSFGKGSDGRIPAASLVAANGTLYGTTQNGGAYTFGGGTAFSIATSGSNEKVLHSFGGGNDGSQPQANLIVARGRFYGTTYAGGAAGFGTVYQMSKTGKERVLHSFTEDYNNDGIWPRAALVEVTGTFYGTTQEGGIALPSCPHSANICDYGTVFALSL
ncbi:MAG: choice-of-anchor tandem repeat GloVer-containing protein [Candidatus Cybelea sp.]